jgi:peptide/nickel transport system permease protein
MTYVLRKMAMVLPTLLVVSLTVFILIRLIPGDPVLLMVGDIQNPQAIAEARRSLGLDQPFIVQYFLWLMSVLTLNLGHSVVTGQEVTTLIADRFWITARVVVVAMAVALFFAVPAGLVAAWQRGRLADRSIVFVSILFLSVPSFWVGLLLILVFGIYLHWFPTIGYAGVAYLVLPVACLALAQAGSFVRLMRASAIDVLRMEYVTHAYAKGLSDGAVLLRHVLKNAFAPTLTFAGWVLGALLAGAAVIETVFTLPGLGRLLVDSIYARDYPLVQGIALFVACIYILMNLLVDMLYPLLDPRVRL